MVMPHLQPWEEVEEALARPKDVAMTQISVKIIRARLSPEDTLGIPLKLGRSQALAIGLLECLEDSHNAQS
jgi:hypothetical protein